jgi:hypothetical protein
MNAIAVSIAFKAGARDLMQLKILNVDNDGKICCDWILTMICD